MCTCHSVCQVLFFIYYLRLFTRATASMFLEKKIQNVESFVSGFEDQLAKDGTIPDQPNALQSRQQQLQVRKKTI